MPIPTSDSLLPAPFHGLIGSGLIGWNAFDRRSWSGSSFHFFSECRRQGLLEGTSGAEVGGWRKLLLLAFRFHPNKATWRMRYYLDPCYRRALTLALAPKIKRLPQGRAVLQIGALFDAPAVAAGRRLCFSYHDGNLAMRLRSPFGALGLSEKGNRKALAYERDLYGRIDVIFTMSEYLRRSFIKDFDVDPCKVVSIGAGANLDTVPEADPGKIYHLPEMLFMGVDFERKGGNILLEAFARTRSAFPEAVLHIVGPRSTPPAELPMAGVIWHGFLDKDEPRHHRILQELFEKCCLFLLPSLYEPFGIAPAEAMLYGLPAIVTGDWALGETVIDGQTGRHVRAGDVADLAEAMRDLLGDPALLRQLGGQARVHALQHFTWSSVVGRLHSALREFGSRYPQSQVQTGGALDRPQSDHRLSRQSPS